MSFARSFIMLIVLLVVFAVVVALVLAVPEQVKVVDRFKCDHEPSCCIEGNNWLHHWDCEKQK